MNKDKIRELIATAVESKPYYIDVTVYADRIEWLNESSITLKFAHLDALSVAFQTKRINLEIDPGYDDPTYGGGGSGKTVITIWPGLEFSIDDAARDDVIPGGAK